jgi:hypothetical protein
MFMVSFRTVCHVLLVTEFKPEVKMRFAQWSLYVLSQTLSELVMVFRPRSSCAQHVSITDGEGTEKDEVRVAPHGKTAAPFGVYLSPEL